MYVLEIVVSTTSTTNEYGVWDIWETTEAEEEPGEEADEEMRENWRRRKEERRRERERRRKDRESRRRQEQLYEKEFFNNCVTHGEKWSLPITLILCFFYLRYKYLFDRANLRALLVVIGVM